MKLVAIVRTPPSPDEAARAVADATGLTLAEARMRLAPEPPALLARLAPDQANVLVAVLRKAGLAAVAVDAHAPTDKDRTAARSFAVAAKGVTFTPRCGDSLALEWADVAAILRGLRASRSEVERTEKSKRLSIGSAVATGGLVMTRSSTNTVRERRRSQRATLISRALGRACSPRPRRTWSSSRGFCARRRRARSTTSGCSASVAGRCRSW